MESARVPRRVARRPFRRKCVETSLLWATLALCVALSAAQGVPSIKQTIGGTYRTNATLYQRSGPYRVDRDLNVEGGVTLTIETGTELYFDTGVGMRIRGTLFAVVSARRCAEARRPR